MSRSVAEQATAATAVVTARQSALLLRPGVKLRNYMDEEEQKYLAQFEDAE